MVMSDTVDLYALKNGLLPMRIEWDLSKSQKDKLYKKYENTAAIAVNSEDYNLLLAVKPTKSNTLDFIETLGYEQLPWPAQVIWTGE